MPEDEGQWQEFNAQEPDEEDAAWANAEPEAESEPGGDSEYDWVDTFDPKWRQEFEGLAYLGHLEAKVDQIPYHSFTVRTLKAGEKIKVVELVKHLEDSIGYARAYRAAIVAAGLVLADGKPLLVAKRNVDVIPQRYRYVTDNWYDPVIDILYDKINDLEGRVIEVLKELGIYQNRREVVQMEEAEVASDEPTE